MYPPHLNIILPPTCIVARDSRLDVLRLARLDNSAVLRRVRFRQVAAARARREFLPERDFSPETGVCGGVVRVGGAMGRRVCGALWREVVHVEGFESWCVCAH